MLRDLEPGVNRPLLESAFAGALEAGGLAERDFRREPGASYNPRPARICYILVHSCKRTESEVLAAAMLAAVCESTPSDALLSMLPLKTVELLQTAALLPEQITYSQAALEAVEIAAAVRLDRARHFHLASPSAAELRRFTEETELYAKAADARVPALAPLLHNILRRFRMKLNRAEAGQPAAEHLRENQ